MSYTAHEFGIAMLNMIQEAAVKYHGTAEEGVKIICRDGIGDMEIVNVLYERDTSTIVIETQYTDDYGDN